MMTKKDKEQNELFIQCSHMYDNIGILNSGLAVVEKNGEFGAINKKGEIVIPLIYYHMSDFEHKLAVAYQIDDNGQVKGCIINNKGKQITPFMFDDMEYVESNYKDKSTPWDFAKVHFDGKVGIVNNLGEIREIPLKMNPWL